jgi:hypothetical protein
MKDLVYMYEQIEKRAIRGRGTHRVNEKKTLPNPKLLSDISGSGVLARQTRYTGTSKLIQIGMPRGITQQLRPRQLAALVAELPFCLRFNFTPSFSAIVNTTTPLPHGAIAFLVHKQGQPQGLQFSSAYP